MTKHRQHLHQIFAAVGAVSEKEVSEKKKFQRKRSLGEEEVSEKKKFLKHLMLCYSIAPQSV